MVLPRRTIVDSKTSRPTRSTRSSSGMCSADHHHNFYSCCMLIIKWMVLFGFCVVAHYLIVEFTKYIENNKTMVGTSTIPLHPERRLLKVPDVGFDDDEDTEENDEVEYFFQLPPPTTPKSATARARATTPGSTSSTSSRSTTTTSSNHHLSVGRSGRGVVLLFHGCTHDGIDWFQLPEERRILTHLLRQGLAVVSISSFDRTNHKCWETTSAAGEGEILRQVATEIDNDNGNGKDNEMLKKLRHRNRDVYRIIRTLPKLLSEMMDMTAENNSRNNHNNKDSAAPIPTNNWMDIQLYGIGASSGGDFVSVLSQYVPFHGMNVMIAPGKTKAWRNVSNLVSSSKYGSSDMLLYHSQHHIRQHVSTSNDNSGDNDGRNNNNNDNNWVPRIAFVYMPIDHRYGSTRNIEHSMVELQSKNEDGENGVDSQTTKTAATTTTTIIPVKTFTCDPIPVTPQTLTDHFVVQDPNHIDVQSGNSAYLTLEEATQFVEQLSSSSPSSSSSSSSQNALIDETNHLLTKDPRQVWSSDIEPIIVNKIFSSQRPTPKTTTTRSRTRQSTSSPSSPPSNDEDVSLLE